MSTQIKILVGLLFTIATTVALIIFGVNEDARMARAQLTFQGRQIEQGAAIFDTYCSTCHGVRGQGVAGKGPPLNRKDLLGDKSPYLKDIGWSGTLNDFIHDTVAAGRPQRSKYYALAGFAQNMPTWSQDYGGPLRPDQVDSVVAFIENWAPGEYSQTEQVVPPDQSITTGGPTPTPRPTVAGCDSTVPNGYGCAKPPFPLPPSADIVGAGKTVFEANCIPCHGANADGKGPAASGLPKPPRNFTDCATMSSFAMDLHYERVNEGTTGGMPAWKGKLTDEQIWDVIMYERSFCQLFDATIQK